MKYLKTVMKVSICLIVVGLVISIIGYAAGGNTRFSLTLEQGGFKYTSSSEKIEKTEMLDEFNNIDINIGLNDVEIIKSDENKIELHYTEGLGEVKYSIENGTLKVTQDKKSNVGIVNLGYDNNYDDYIRIYVKGSNDMKLKVSNGDLLLQGLTLEKLDLELGFGDADINNCEVDNFVLVNSNGEINLNNCKIKTKAEITDKFGDITIGNTDISELIINLSNGDFELTKSKIGSIDIKNTFGEVSLEDCDINTLEAVLSNGDFEANGRFTGGINIDNTFGEVELDVESEIKYNYSITAKFGDIIVDGNEFDNKVSIENNGENNLIITSSNGDVIVNFKK